MSGCPIMAMGAPFCVCEQALHGGQRYRLVCGHHAALRVAGGNSWNTVAHEARDHSHAHESLPHALEIASVSR